MKNVKLPDLSKVRSPKSERVLPPQSSAEDTSNWDNRVIALPDPKRSSAQFITNDYDSSGIIEVVENPYLEQERLKSVKRKQ